MVNYIKYNVLHVVLSLEIGGLERVVLALANNMPGDRYQTYVCSINKPGALGQYMREQGNLMSAGQRGRIQLGTFTKLEDVVRKNHIDLIHTHNYPGLFYSYMAARLHGIPIVHTQHGRFLTDRYAVLRKLEKWMSKRVDVYVCVSMMLQQEVRARIGMKESNLEVIHNGIQIDARERNSPCIDHSKVIIGSVGRLAEVKNYKLLLRAFASIADKYPNVSLELVGDGATYADLLKEASELLINDRVVMHGFQVDVAKYLDGFDIFVLPSFSEGHSISLLEALNLRKVCIASAVGGNTEIIRDGENGFLFQSNDIQALIKKLTYVIDNLRTKEMERIREEGFNTIATCFSLGAMLRRYDETYQKVFERTGRTHSA